MRWNEFSEAHDEAQCFLARCQALLPMASEWEFQQPKDNVKSAALRRASMDLTRALAKLRQS